MIQLIMIAHFISDFLFQHPWMAVNKHRNMYALSWHVAVYTFSLGLILCPFVDSIKNLMVFIIINGFLHFITDLNTSRISAKLWPLENKYYFFCMIGLDQLIHMLCLTTTIGILEF